MRTITPARIAREVKLTENTPEGTESFRAWALENVEPIARAILPDGTTTRMLAWARVQLECSRDPVALVRQALERHKASVTDGKRQKASAAESAFAASLPCAGEWIHGAIVGGEIDATALLTMLRARRPEWLRFEDENGAIYVDGRRLLAILQTVDVQSVQIVRRYSSPPFSLGAMLVRWGARGRMMLRTADHAIGKCADVATFALPSFARPGLAATSYGRAVARDVSIAMGAS